MRNSTASLFLSRRQKFLLSVCMLIICKQSGRGREIFLCKMYKNINVWSEIILFLEIKKRIQFVNSLLRSDGQ